jgi:hypothetical protein
MSSTFATVIILAAGATAALITLLVHRRIQADVRQHHQEVGSAVFLQLGFILAVLLAFVFNEVWSEYDVAEEAIDRECAALHGTAMLAATLRAEQARIVLLAERDYVSSVLTSEWHTMARYRTESIETVSKLRDMITAVAHLQPVDPNSASTRDQMLSLLAQAHAQRETRIFQANEGVPGAIWTVLIFLSMVLTLSVSLSSIKYRVTASIIVAAIFATAIAGILVLVRLLDFPFEGALALQSKDFTTVLVKITALLPPG